MASSSPLGGRVPNAAPTTPPADESPEVGEGKPLVEAGPVGGKVSIPVAQTDPNDSYLPQDDARPSLTEPEMRLPTTGLRGALTRGFELRAPELTRPQPPAPRLDPELARASARDEVEAHVMPAAIAEAARNPVEPYPGFLVSLLNDGPDTGAVSFGDTPVRGHGVSASLVVEFDGFRRPRVAVGAGGRVDGLGGGEVQIDVTPDDDAPERPVDDDDATGATR